MSGDRHDNWIPDSYRFAQHVLTDVMEELGHNNPNLTNTERQALAALHVRWMAKLVNRQPESNRLPPAPEKPANRDKKIAPQQPNLSGEEERVEHNIYDVDDYEVVNNRICIPRLRSAWKLRHFTIMMPAIVLKRGLLNKHLYWGILDKVMEASDAEGQAELQKFVDEVVASLRS